MGWEGAIRAHGCILSDLILINEGLMWLQMEKQMAKLRKQRDLAESMLEDEENRRRCLSVIKRSLMKRDFGVDGDFERKQQEILVLWQSCNVSLVRRTYFFLLFKGDEADSVYFKGDEAELS
ncbi:kinesin-like protein KIN-7F [Brassica rapa]|uniref:kinesin-like protein KIN-7F n=1 Tax=Brassica campestris TaxID=3711 RepID=UPI00142E11A9|nr:kinesin-like protein KIN-7F [Brassica rapa]